MRTFLFRRPRAPRLSARASSKAVESQAEPSPSRRTQWWRRHRGALLLLAAAAIIGGGLVRMVTDRTVARVVTFEEP
jgi:hypothetical protein